MTVEFLCQTLCQRRTTTQRYDEQHQGSLPSCWDARWLLAHNATVYPHNSDWDKLAEITGDPSWKSDNMRQYFERLEQCRYRATEEIVIPVGTDLMAG